MNIWLNIKYFFKNFYHVYLTSKNNIKSFGGYGRLWMAKKYANFRTSAGSEDGVTGRKRHFVISYGPEIVIVANRIEIENMMKTGMIRSQNIFTLLKNAHYISK